MATALGRQTSYLPTSSSAKSRFLPVCPLSHALCPPLTRSTQTSPLASMSCDTKSSPYTLPIKRIRSHTPTTRVLNSIQCVSISRSPVEGVPILARTVPIADQPRSFTRLMILESSSPSFITPCPCPVTRCLVRPSGVCILCDAGLSGSELTLDRWSER